MDQLITNVLDIASHFRKKILVLQWFKTNRLLFRFHIEFNKLRN